MATDPQSLASQSKCYTCTGESQTEGFILALLATISGKSSPMATDAQSLVTQAKCYLCYGMSLYQAMKLALLAQISIGHNLSNNTDPAFLLSQAACFDCFSTADVGQLMELVLLQQIAT